MMLVAGIDACLQHGNKPWIVVVLEDGRLHAMEAQRSLGAICEAWQDIDHAVVNMPIIIDDASGPPGASWRPADHECRTFLGPWADAVEPVDYFMAAEALAVRGEQLRTRSRSNGGIYEGRPEVSFQALRETLGGPGHLAYPRGTLEGTRERLGLLHEVGLRPARSLGGVGLVPPKMLLDATVLAWTARRLAAGEARMFPELRALEDGGRGHAVVYA